METNASAVANYLLELAEKNNAPLKQLGLMKRVYIVHGFTLALLDRLALNERFDKVEAWRLGPVVTSIYHQFNDFGVKPINRKAMIMDDWFNPNPKEAVLEDEDIKKICDMVWKWYKDTTDYELVELTHNPGTPWSEVYRAGENKIIPDSLIQEYYKKLVAKMIG